MSKRPVFMSSFEGKHYVDVQNINFTWFPGFAISQKQKSINSLHENFAKLYDYNILEVSTKSNNLLGVKLSAFNLSFPYRDKSLTVEVAFQSSKVFSNHGKADEIVQMEPIDAKKTIKELHNKYKLLEFDYFGRKFPLSPKTLFYDWLYINVLWQNKELINELTSANYLAFTDIAYNPEKSINCQAYSLALFISLYKRGKINDEFIKQDSFIKFFNEEKIGQQLSLFDILDND